jgi:hypothetical protein
MNLQKIRDLNVSQIVRHSLFASEVYGYVARRHGRYAAQAELLLDISILPGTRLYKNSTPQK